MLSCPELLITAIRREILGVLAAPGDLTVPAATVQVATGWSTRRRRYGHSPSSVRAAEALVHQVGADIAADVAADPT